MMQTQAIFANMPSETIPDGNIVTKNRQHINHEKSVDKKVVDGRQDPDGSIFESDETSEQHLASPLLEFIDALNASLEDVSEEGDVKNEDPIQMETPILFQLQDRVEMGDRDGIPVVNDKLDVFLKEGAEQEPVSEKILPLQDLKDGGVRIKTETSDALVQRAGLTGEQLVENTADGEKGPVKDTDQPIFVKNETKPHVNEFQTRTMPVVDTKTVRGDDEKKIIDAKSLLKADDGKSVGRTENNAAVATTNLQNRNHSGKNNRGEPKNRFMKNSPEKIQSSKVEEAVPESRIDEKPVSHKKRWNLDEKTVRGVAELEGTTEKSAETGPTISKSFSTGIEQRPLILQPSTKRPEPIAQIAKGDQPLSVTKSLQTDVMNQIVEKAVLKTRKNRPEMTIKLKPEFMGNVRMNITTHDKQIMIKVMAEHPVVKDIIESNIHQLRAELNNQGMEIDKFEVLVYKDPDQSGEHQNHSRFNSGKFLNDNNENKQKQQDSLSDNKQIFREDDDLLTDGIDYFA